MKRPKSVNVLENLGQTRLSPFFLRDFLYSEIAEIYGIPNVPDDPSLAIEAGRHLCPNSYSSRCTDDPDAFLDFLWAIKRVSLFAGFAVVLVFIVLLFAADIVPREKRALWLVVLILGHMAVTPFFWYFYLRSPK